MTTASYPGALKTYTDKVDGIDTVKAADINSVQAEVQAIEAALSPITSPVIATDGTHVGYTQLATGSFASAPGAISVAGANYIKFVVLINVTTAGSASAVTLTVNGAASQRSSYTVWTSTSAITASNAGTAALISNNAAPVTGDTISVELFNVAGTTFKPLSWFNGNGYGFGTITNSAAITSITLAASTYPTTATYTIYGVK